MKKYLLPSSIVVVMMVVALSALSIGLVSGKGHVPAGKVQVCHRGTTIEVGASALPAHLKHGDGQLPACDFGNVFFKESPCLPGADAQGRAPLANAVNRADGITPACPADGSVY